MRNTTLFIVFLVNMLAFTIGCQDANDNKTGIKDAIVYKDVIEEYDVAEKLHITTHVDLAQELKEHFLYGWSAPSKTQPYRWAEGSESKLLFIAKKDRNITMRLDCRPLPYTALQQTISVFLNSNFIEKITLKPQKNNVEIVLPNDYIQDGFNDMTFKYAYAKKPCEIRNSKDCRELSVFFKRIEFDVKDYIDANIELIDGKIRQPLNTYLNYYALLPQNSYLHLDLNGGSKDIYGVVKISSGGFPSQIYEFDKSGTHRIELSDFPNAFVKISFVTDNKDEQNSKKTDIPEGQYVEWSNVKLQTLNENAADSTQHKNIQDIEDIQQRLNTYDVIYIVLDAFNAKHSSSYGYSRKTTPFLDELAQESIVFDKMFVGEPYTLASTGTLFTSKYSHEHGLIGETDRLNPVIPTVNELLLDSNVETYLITEHQFLREAWGLSRGFSTVFLEKEYNRKPNKVVEIIDNIYASHSQKRKFLYIHLLPPHSPYLPPDKFRVFMEPEPDFIEPNQNNLNQINRGELHVNKKQLDYIVSLYDANILFADHIAKTLFTYLKEAGLLDKSIIFLSSDHGEAFMEHGKRGHGTSVFDEMIHVPFLVCFPKELNISPARIQHIASIIDIAPTLADIYGIQHEIDFSGKSLLPGIFHDIPLHPFIYAEALLPKVRTVRGSKFKYILSPKHDMLFNLHEDPLELQNIVKDLPVTVGYYRQTMRQFSHQQSPKSHKVDMDKLDNETIQRLKGLGYMQ